MHACACACVIIYETLTVTINPGLMSMKGYSNFPKALGLEPHRQMQFSDITRTLVKGLLPLYTGGFSVFYIGSR